jgi:hypothetical protein
MATTVKTILGFEQNGLGIHMLNLDEDYNGFSVKLGYEMLIASTFLWTAIGLYFEKVLPKEFGK